MTYTKGEWKTYADYSGKVERIVVERDGLTLETICYISRETIESEANAHLISAAPDMYEALKEISEGKGRYSMDKLTHASNTIDDMKELALNALLKAEGGTK